MDGLNGVGGNGREFAATSGESEPDRDHIDAAAEFETIIRLAPTSWLCIVNAPGIWHELPSAVRGRQFLTLQPHLQERLQEVIDEIVSAQMRCEIGKTSGAEGLTGRQREIANMVRQGASNKIIARDLGLSVGTVKVHMHRIFRTLQINNRVQLATMPSL